MSRTVAKRMESAEPSIVKTLYAYDGQPGYLSMASGNPNWVTFPVNEFEEITANIFKDIKGDEMKIKGMFAYGAVAGIPELIDALKQRYIVGMGIGNVETDDIAVFAGAQQLQDLLAKAYLNEDDICLVEEVTYGGALTAFWGYHAQTIGVPMDEDGIIPEELEKICQEYGDKIKLLYVIPVFQNPMGSEWTEERKKAVYDLAVKYDFLILEDSPYFEIRYEGENPKSIKSYDTTGHVIYGYSMSKILAPGLRIGLAIADKEVLFWLARGKEVQDMNNAQLTQMLAAKYLTEYDIDAHIKENIAFYDVNRKAMLDALDKYVGDVEGVKWTHPNGGFFLWVDLPEGISGDKFAEYLLTEEKLIILPGSLYRPDGKDINAVRLCYSVLSPEQITEGIERLGRGLKKMVAEL